MDRKLRQHGHVSRTGLVEFLRWRVVALVLGGVVFTILSWVAVEYYGYQQNAQRRRENLVNAKKSEIRGQVKSAIDFIAFARRSEEHRLRDRLTSRVDEACHLAQQLYEQRDDKSMTDVRYIICDALRGMRWNDGQGYYFVVDLQGITQLQPLRPELEASNDFDLHDDQDTDFIQDLLRIARDAGEGFSEAGWKPTSEATTESPKISYVRLFEPLGWIIGTSESRGSTDAELQSELKKRLSAMSYAGGEGYIFVANCDGVALVNRTQPELIGHDIKHLTDAQGASVFRALYDASMRPDGDFVRYAWNKPSLRRPVEKLSYACGVPDWEWVVGSGLYLDDIDAAIVAERAELTRSAAQHIGLATASGLLVCMLIMLVWRSAASCLKADIAPLMEFFREAVHLGCRVAPGAFRFAEFAALATGANRMIDARDESERHLADTLNSIGEGVISTDTSGLVIGINPVAEMLTQWSQEEAVGRPIEEVMKLVDATSQQVINNPVRQAIEEDAVTAPAKGSVLVRRDGSELHIASSASPIRDTLGRSTGAVLVFRDVTPQTNAETLLRESQERLETVLHAAQDAVIMLDSAGNISMWNDAAVRIFGYSAEEACGQNLHELLSPQRYRVAYLRAFAIFQQAGRGDAVGRVVELSALRKGGEEFPVELSLSAVQLRGQWHAVGILRDITDRKRAEERLETQRKSLDRERNNLQAIFDAAQVGLLLVDEQANVMRVNQVIAQIAGKPVHELLHRQPGEGLNCIHTHETGTACGASSHCTLCPLRNTIDSVFRSGDEVRGVEASMRLIVDGRDEELHFALNAAPLKVDDQRHVLLAVTDITQQKRTENELRVSREQLTANVEALKAANKALEESNRKAGAATRAKSEFLTNMSHEIRTPMTAILGFADFLRHESGLDKAPPARRDAIDTIYRNGEYLLGLMNNILDLSKIEAEKLEVDRTYCSPANVLAEVVSLMRVRAEAKQLSLDFEYGSHLPATIQSDPLRLRQILINLVGNAIKFTATGSVRVATRMLYRADKMPLLQFNVIDSGIGITPEQLGRLFRPFTQADSSTTRRFGGTGLGLTISKRLAVMLGGDISVSSEPGQGSTFSVTIETGPLEDCSGDDTSGELVPTRKSQVAGRITQEIRLAGRILLAEDGPDNQRLISFLLTRAGADVTVAENGQIACDEALAAKASGVPYDLILLDMQMPVMDGYTAVRKLREQKYQGPIIALTAHAMEGHERECRDAGCDDYLSKPIDFAKFLPTIAHSLEQGQGQTGDIVPVETCEIITVP